MTPKELQDELQTLEVEELVEDLQRAWDDDKLLKLVVELKARLTPELPGHGLYKPREHDPILGELEVHGTMSGRFVSDKPSFEEVDTGLHSATKAREEYGDYTV